MWLVSCCFTAMQLTRKTRVSHLPTGPWQVYRILSLIPYRPEQPPCSTFDIHFSKPVPPGRSRRLLPRKSSYLKQRYTTTQKMIIKSLWPAYHPSFRLPYHLNCQRERNSRRGFHFNHNNHIAPAGCLRIIHHGRRRQR